MKRAVHVRRACPSGTGKGTRALYWRPVHPGETAPPGGIGPYDEAPPPPGATNMSTPPPSRRALVGGALAASAVAVTATAEPAYAAGGKKHDGPPLLSKPDRHLVTRFSYGLTPELAKDVRKAGGGLAWFE